MFRKKNRRTERKKEEGSTFIAVDIGTENIKTALFRKKNKEIEVIGYSRVSQKPFSMNKALIIDTSSVLNRLDESIGFAIGEAESRFHGISLPESAIVGIAGELISGVPIGVNVERDKNDEIITEEEVKNVVEKVKEYSFDSIKEEIAEEHGIQSTVLEEISTEIDSIMIDGLKVNNPVGLTGSSITYRVFSSFAPKIQVDSINHIIDSLKIKLERIVVEPYALSKAINEKSIDSEGGIFIDVGSGTTDISIIKNGDIQGIKIFAIGGRVYTRRIESIFDIDYLEAEEMKLKYSAGSLDEYKKKQIKKGIKGDINTWLLGIELALSEFDEIEIFPNKIYICGGGALLPDIMEGLIEYPWIQRLKFQKHPKVSFIFPNKVKDVNDLTKSLNNPIDVTPLVLTRTIL